MLAAPVSHDFDLLLYRSTQPDVPDCWLALPHRPTPGAIPLVAVHGIYRDARGQATVFGPRAAAQGRIVVAPLFPSRDWKGYQRVIAPRRADLALLDLLDALQQRHVANFARFDLFGYSGGAQFAHRFSLIHPDRTRRLAFCAAGWMTFPEARPYPYGVSTMPGEPMPRLIDALALPIEVCVGEFDNEVDANTRSNPAVDAQQGRNRLERAQRWVSVVRRIAQEYSIEPQVKLHVLPGCGHDFRSCARQGGLLDHVLKDVPAGADESEAEPGRAA